MLCQESQHGKIFRASFWKHGVFSAGRISARRQKRIVDYRGGIRFCPKASLFSKGGKELNGNHIIPQVYLQMPMGVI
jgi:hypothetical protein